jgi:two-component system, NarL family, invasion response regulator UvrY
MIRILLADDHPVVRKGLRTILEGDPTIEIVSEAASGEEAVERSRISHPQVVLLDIGMPGRGGIETAQDIKRLNPAVKILMLTIHAEDNFAVRCLREGADGYITKDAEPEVLLQAVHKLAAGGKYVSPSLAERLALYLDANSLRAPHEALSNRELEVMLRIAAGKRPRDIAEELHLSVKTVSTYRSRILQKMNFRSNAEIMRYALETKLDQ